MKLSDFQIYGPKDAMDRFDTETALADAEFKNSGVTDAVRVSQTHPGVVAWYTYPTHVHPVVSKLEEAYKNAWDKFLVSSKKLSEDRLTDPELDFIVEMKRDVTPSNGGRA